MARVSFVNLRSSALQPNEHQAQQFQRSASRSRCTLSFLGSLELSASVDSVALASSLPDNGFRSRRKVENAAGNFAGSRCILLAWLALHGLLTWKEIAKTVTSVAVVDLDAVACSQ